MLSLFTAKAMQENPGAEGMSAGSERAREPESGHKYVELLREFNRLCVANTNDPSE